MILGIDHIGIAVVDMKAAGEAMELLALSKFDAGIAEKYGVACEFWGSPEQSKGVAIELVAPVRKGASIQGQLDRQGPGLYHVAFEVDDIDKELSRLRGKGAIAIDREPCAGAREGMKVAFVYLGLSTGLLIELVEYHTS